MKYVIVIGVILLVVWLARSGRGRAPEQRPPSPARQSRDGKEALPACAHCGVHLPTSEAWPGRGGMYCCEAHRRIAEASDGPG